MLLVGALLCMGATACGGSRDIPRSAPGASDSSTTGAPTTITSSAIPPGQSLRGDGDADNPSDIDGNGDNDTAATGGPDRDNDSPTRASYDFPDRDDKVTFAYGHPPSATVGRAISTVVKRYYAAASMDDGAAACSLLIASLAHAVPEDYGQAGPSYLRGGKTCQAVLSMLFQHFHEQLTEAVTVVEVRVEDSDAQVVFSSRKMPASHIFLVGQGHSWKVSALIGQPLP
ncbi:MAG: hypothetical protein WAU77_14380 [Solirubrobacteraceae bacterium]